MKDILLDIKPLSVNEAWKGRRFKSNLYKEYERNVMWMLPKMDMPESPYELHFEFGFSNINSDLDNPIKPIQDILQKTYDFNDREVYKITATKIMVPKGKEYSRIKIKHYELP